MPDSLLARARTRLNDDSCFAKVVADPSCEVNVLSALGGTLITPGTEAFFVSQQYSLVFVLDMSAAMHCVVRRGNLAAVSVS